MKFIVKIICVLFFSAGFLSCEIETPMIPEVQMAINKNQLVVNESMILKFSGVADQIVVYMGDYMHDYELRENSNTGFVVNKGAFSYAYSTPGQYKVVCVSSTYNNSATILNRDTCSLLVTVIDDVTEIDKLSCSQVLYDEVFADRLANDAWLMVLPRKVKYNLATPSISLSQKLRFYIQSDSTDILVNEIKYSNSVKYDLSTPVNISVTSHHGTVRPYILHTLYYPEFKSFKLLGAEGKLIRNEFDYSTMELQVTLPVGTDVRNVVPEFSLYSTTEEVYINDIEQISGLSVVDFTKNVTYRLVEGLSSNSDVVAATQIKIKIFFQ